MSQSFARQSLLASTVLIGAMAFAAPAIAQELPEAVPEAASVEQGMDVEAIVVTGSRIARPDLSANSPISVVTGETLKLTGSTSVEDYLRNLPQVVPGIGGQTNNGSGGAATIDLRNLTEQRTLVLVDGKRFVPYDREGIVDVNMIPAALIKRVDVVTGGASAVYGSDAIAGVVNFILDDRFEGIRADAQYGLTQRGDGRQFDGSITVGQSFSEGRGNIVINAGYTKEAALTQAKRRYSEFALGQADLAPSGSLTDTPGNISDNFPTICSQAEIDDGNCYAQFRPNGDLGPVVGSFNFNPYNLFQTPLRRYQVHALARYEFSDSVEFFGRASYVNSKVSTIVAPSGTFFFPFTVNLDNPFLSDQARGVLGPLDTDGDGNVDIAFGRRTTELGTRDSIYTNKAMQFVGGLRGEIARGLRYEAFAQYGQVKRSQRYLNDIDFARTQQGLLVREVGGVPTCIDPSNGCVPVNLFGAGNLTPEAGDFIRLDLEADDKTTQFVTGHFRRHVHPALDDAGRRFRLRGRISAGEERFPARRQPDRRQCARLRRPVAGRRQIQRQGGVRRTPVAGACRHALRAKPELRGRRPLFQVQEQRPQPRHRRRLRQQLHQLDLQGRRRVGAGGGRALPRPLPARRPRAEP